MRLANDCEYRVMQPAKLALETGRVFTGISCGAEGESSGELCFNTSMTGYQEILTDPSYRGQIVTMTYSHIGNYGVNAEDEESRRPFLAGFVVRELSRTVSNFRAAEDLRHYLQRHGIIAMDGIDTRALVRLVREQGAVKAILSTADMDDLRLVEKAKNSPGLTGRDLVREVMTRSRQTWRESLSPWMRGFGGSHGVDTDGGVHVVALDFGMKLNIARHLKELGSEVTIVPGDTPPQDIIALNPTGIFLSNGPGDPEPLTYAIETVRELLPRYPLFGICLGHQILGLACGAKTFKLKYGHRGANQPVLNCETGKVEITTQNHGFAVEEASLPPDLKVTHRNLNDNTVAGLRHVKYPAFSVQYHPEASSGPHDSRYLFDEFAKALNEFHRHALPLLQ
jgi:carbamoyl-phosphate synthase small subunit